MVKNDPARLLYAQRGGIDIMQLAQHFPCLMLLHYALGDPLWIIVACRQNKKQENTEQISTGAVVVDAGGWMEREESVRLAST
jgi:hypothetical protein